MRISLGVQEVLEQALRSCSEAVKGLGSAVRSQDQLTCEGARLGYSAPISWLLILVSYPVRSRGGLASPLSWLLALWLVGLDNMEDLSNSFLASSFMTGPVRLPGGFASLVYLVLVSWLLVSDNVDPNTFSSNRPIRI